MLDNSAAINQVFDRAESVCSSDESSSEAPRIPPTKYFQLRLGSKVVPQVPSQSSSFASDTELTQRSLVGDDIEKIFADEMPKLIKFSATGNENNLSPRLEGYLLSGHKNPTFSLNESEVDLAQKYYESTGQSDIYTISDSVGPISTVAENTNSLINSKSLAKTHAVDNCFLAKIKTSLHRHRENETSLMIALQVRTDFTGKLVKI